MENKSLEIAKEVVIKAIDEANIENYDKLELLLNLYQFLDEYKENLKILRKK